MSKSVLARVAGVLDASNFAFGINPSIPAAQVSNSPGASGAQTMTLYSPNIVLGDGSYFNPFSTTAPLTFDIGSNAETVTPSSVATIAQGPAGLTVNITATFANVHGQGCRVTTGTAGLQEAINYANTENGGGIVVVDGVWAKLGGTSAILSAAVPATGVSVLDNRSAGPQWWAANSGATALVRTGSALEGWPVTALTTNGAIGPHTSGNYVITKAGVLADTLAAPVTGTEDGIIIAVMSNTANAHTITATGLLNTGSAAVNVATFAAFAGANLVLQASAAKWNVLTSNGITFS